MSTVITGKGQRPWLAPLAPTELKLACQPLSLDNPNGSSMYPIQGAPEAACIATQLLVRGWVKVLRLMMSNLNHPLSTCSSANCQDCPLKSRLHCHFAGKDLAQFLVIALPPFIAGGVGVARIHLWLLLPWIGLTISYFGLVEIRVMCSHCPHYAEPETKSLQCWANYGSPKLWQYRPGPMTLEETIVFFAGLVLIAGYPLAFLVFSAQWLLLALFAVLVILMGTGMRFMMCSQCINFACPFNCVDSSTRTLFFARNPQIAEAWKDIETST